MLNELVDRTGLPEAISKQNSLPITRKDYSLIGLPLRPDAEESARRSSPQVLARFLAAAAPPTRLQYSGAACPADVGA